MNIKTFGILCAASVALVVITGCKTPTLESGGAYNVATTNIITGAVTSKPDFAFFAVDSAFDLSYKTIDGIFLFEQNNRAALWAISPDIKHGLDRARPVAADIAKRYVNARTAYQLNPSTGQLKTMEGLLSQIQTLAVTVQAASHQ